MQPRSRERPAATARPDAIHAADPPQLVLVQRRGGPDHGFPAPAVRGAMTGRSTESFSIVNLSDLADGVHDLPALSTADFRTFVVRLREAEERPAPDDRATTLITV